LGKFKIPDLRFGYEELEPHIDAKTMEIHHSKHHQAYTNGLNEVWEKMDDVNQDKGITTLMMNLDQIKPELRDDFEFFGGGHHNHELFWTSMKPDGGGEPKGPFAEDITKTFGDFNQFKEKFSALTGSIRGAGWGWLVYNPKPDAIEFKAMSNQTSPITEHLEPLLGCDVWEHAYYLKYQNKRADYISAWWNVINWQEVEQRYTIAKKFGKKLFEPVE
jgi:superoxide dismutase, Fe-Mn family